MPAEIQLPTPLNASNTAVLTPTRPAITTSVAAGSASGVAVSANSVDYDTFLKLLVAEMKFQDPTDPADATKYVAQLATFSSVEQSITTNNKLDALLASISLTQADSVLGRTVTSADGAITGQVSALRIDAGGSIAVLEDGREVRLGTGVTIA